MALDPRALAKVIEIINSREKGGGDQPKKAGGQIKPYAGGTERTPTGRTNEFSYAGGLDDYLRAAQAKGLDISNLKSAGDLQGRIYDSLMSSPEGQQVLKGMWGEYGDTRAGSGQVLPQNLSEQDLAGLRSSFADDKLGGRTQMILDRIKPRVPQRTPEPMPEPTPQTPREKEIEGISREFGQDWMSTKSKMGPRVVGGVQALTPTSRYGSMYSAGDNYYNVKYKDGTTDVLSVDEFNEMFPDEKIPAKIGKVNRIKQGNRVYFEQGKGVYTVDPKTGQKMYGGKDLEGYL